MGRRLSSSSALTSPNGMTLLPGQMGVFGTGRYEVFFESGTFTPRPGVFRARVRVWGGGGGVTADGGTSSFGALMSATGGTRGVGEVAGLGGVGVGGDFQASGGPGGAGEGGGGGAAGTELGTGGAGGIAYALGRGGGGGAVGGKRGGNGGASGPGSGAGVLGQGLDNAPTITQGFVPDLLGQRSYPALNLAPVAKGDAPFFIHPFVGFAFTGGGGAYDNNWQPAQMSGGEGGGGCGGHVDLSSNLMAGGHGGVFGGGGGANVAAGSTKAGGRGGWLADNRWIGGGQGGAKGRAGSGGAGYARGEFAVTPGVGVPVTVAAGGSTSTGQSAGLVIVEF